MEALTFYEGFKQVTNQPTHIVPDSQSCIDLIFTDKSNLLSLHVNYHHQIIEIILSNWKSKYFKCILATCGRNVEISKQQKECNAGKSREMKGYTVREHRNFPRQNYLIYFWINIYM